MIELKNKVKSIEGQLDSVKMLSLANALVTSALMLLMILKP